MLTPPSTPVVCTVSELTRDVKILLESHFDYVAVEGEIGDFTAASSGHWYFTLKDSDAQIRCAMFRRANQRITPTPGRGDHVRIRARVSLYEARGEFQLICEHLAPAGDGVLQLAFERLKQRLDAEGLFAAERKRPIPEDATRIGVVTSATGAAIHDILSVLARRSPRASVWLYPVPVQGEGAAAAIAAAIGQANTLHADGVYPLDVLLVGRGGGSLEDLWAFNEEVVARAIADSALPVVSAVGHEVDFTIADFVADRRAATPSAAAELVTRDQREWQQRFDGVQLHLQQRMQQRLKQTRQQLQNLSTRIRHPGHRLRLQRREWDAAEARLRRAMQQRIVAYRAGLETRALRLARHHPGQRLVSQRGDWVRLHGRLQTAMNGALTATRNRLAQQQKLLDALSPLNTLERGYAIVTDGRGRALRESADVSIGEAIGIRLARGQVEATVTGKGD